MKLKQIKFPILAAALSLILTGCFPTERLESSSQTSENSVNADSKTETSIVNSESEKDNPNEKLYRDLKLDEIETPTEVPKIKLTGLKNYTFEKYEALSIFNGKKVDKEYDTIGSGGELIAENIYLSFSNDYLWLKCGDDAHTRIYQRAIESDFNKFLTYHDKEFDDFSVADAIKPVKDIIDELDIQNLGEPRYVSITSDEMNKILDEYDTKHPEEPYVTRLNEDEKMYYVEYSTEFNGIPIPYDADFGIPPIGDDPWKIKGSSPTLIRSVVTKTGVKIIFADLLVNDYELGEKVPVNYNPKEALDFLMENECSKYPEGRKMIECKLVYAVESGVNLDKPEQTYIYTPVWEFTSEFEDPLGKHTHCYYVRVDDGTVINGN